MNQVTAVTVFHRSADGSGFAAWARQLLDSARVVDGHLSGQVSTVDDPRLDHAVAVTFSEAAAMHAWLDGPQRAEVLAAGQERGFWRSSGDIVISADGPASPGVGVFRHTVAAGKEPQFLATQARLSAAAVSLAGHEGTALLPADAPGEWISMVRYRTGPQLSEWMRSTERAEALQGLRSTLSRDFSVVSNTTPFATTVRVENGQALMTPNWKSAMLVLLVLYPTVMLLSRFLGPALNDLGAQPWLSLWVSQIVSVIAMQWWLMPVASKPFRRWLDPVDGAGARITAVGAVVIVAVYAVTLTLFASVHELQFWDYMD
ncbi:antibiotic biosynthesis monooxygenase [Mycolicibacterium iranicum]|uniref:antibiotic biosynthesis monooxygenase n=1 Tax=Mycolicibacterium iranicum TaxID=912594 RepID=UPI000AE48E41|nr:antibiotic biosynthesis monooxygenase [Mycolicibacterium iranicum]